MKPRRFIMEEKRTIEEILGWIEMELTSANILTAMKMLHDTAHSYSDREKEYLNEFADIPFSEEEDDEDDEK
jgi:hypothetical protein